jgi:L-ascorbate metabolism protein UlaG (beta-lactamase superfamily)
VLAAQKLRAKLSVPMHYGTFELSDEGEFEPVTELLKATAQNPDAWKVLEFGFGHDVP